MNNNDSTEKLLRVRNKHLEDIARSLRIIAGREEPLQKVVKKPSYAESYLSKDPIETDDK